MIGIAVEPKTQKDLDKLGVGLQKLAEEDPTFRVETNEETGQTVISGMGELHLDIIIDRLRREFKVECNQGRPQVTYKEAITKPVELRETFKKQTGGRGKYADIIVRIEPADDDFEGSLQFVDEVKGGNVPKEYIPSVQKGFQTAMKNGVLAGYPVERLKVTLLDGSFHPVDSDQLSFELCAIQAFKHGSEKAGPVLMEPIMKIEVVTPEESMGDVIGDLNKRRGQVEEWKQAQRRPYRKGESSACGNVRLRDRTPYNHLRTRHIDNDVRPLQRGEQLDCQERAHRVSGPCGLTQVNKD